MKPARVRVRCGAWFFSLLLLLATACGDDGGGGDVSGGVSGDAVGDGASDGASHDVVSANLERILVPSAAPLVRRDGALAPACRVAADESIEGVELRFVLQHTDPWVASADPGPLCAGERERDWSLRPGDRVEETTIQPGDTLGASDFALAVDCVEPLPDAEPGACEGAEQPAFTNTTLAYRAFTGGPDDGGTARCEPAAVVLLIDMSGSVQGFVNSDDEYREGFPGSFPIPPDDERRMLATDQMGLRQQAAIEFLRSLNANDEAVVMGFRERSEAENLRVLCSAETPPAAGSLAGEPAYVRQAVECWGVNRDIFENELHTPTGDEGGRTPLWDAVLAAADILERDDLEVPPNRHIVVISDGPDTCSASSPAFSSAAPATQCSQTGYDAVYTRLAGEAAPPIHVHFVQLQARGYPDRDPRQVELACATGGHYQFVNQMDFERTQNGQLGQQYEEAIAEALLRVRYSLAGYWTLRATSADLDGLAPGTLQGAGGTLTLSAPELAPQPLSGAFGRAVSPQWGDWDSRVVFPR